MMPDLLTVRLFEWDARADVYVRTEIFLVRATQRFRLKFSRWINRTWVNVVGPPSRTTLVRFELFAFDDVGVPRLAVDCGGPSTAAVSDKRVVLSAFIRSAIHGVSAAGTPTRPELFGAVGLKLELEADKQRPDDGWPQLTGYHFWMPNGRIDNSVPQPISWSWPRTNTRLDRIDAITPTALPKTVAATNPFSDRVTPLLQRFGIGNEIVDKPPAGVTPAFKRRVLDWRGRHVECFELELSHPFRILPSRVVTTKAFAPRLPLQVDIESRVDRDLTLLQRQPPGGLFEPFVPGDPVTWGLGLATVSTRAIKVLWNRHLATPYYAPLHWLRGERRLSAMPRWDEVWCDGARIDDGPLAAKDPTWVLLLRMDDTQARPSGAPTVSPAPESLQLGMAMLHLGTFPTLMGDAPPPAPAPGKLENEVEIVLALERLRTTPNSAARRRVRVGQAAYPDTSPARAQLLRETLGLDPQPIAVFANDGKLVERRAPTVHLAGWYDASAQPPPPSIRLGAFQFRLDTAGGPAPKKPGYLKAWVVPQDADNPGLHVSLQFDLSITAFVPATQDVPELEMVEALRARPKPLLIDLARASGPAATLQLVVKESSLPREGQRIRLDVFAPQDTLPAHDVLVIDSEPFLVALVQLPPLAGTGDGAQLATFGDNVEGTSWQIVAKPSRYDLWLPPQAIGESTLKHAPDYQPPDLTKKGYADFRFAPPTHLNVFTTWRKEERKWVEPPTNTRRIFGDASQRAPGAPVKAVRSELLYGMPLTIETEHLLVTELTANLGLLPARLVNKTLPWGDAPKHVELARLLRAAQEARYVPFREQWDQAHLAFGRRLGVLALNQLTGEQATLTEKVSFHLRRAAEIRRPVAMPPAGGELNSPYGLPQTPERPRSADPGWGLAGGSDWGFESTEVYESVWRDPRSDLGEVAGVHFSALGGWGYQKGTFDNRRTSIISRTALGRTHFYSLERVGRIGVFWNRAKHVILYERTVLPSDQFHGQQPDEMGRPLIRKVREFVEILQPERRYPESGNAPVTRGCVQATRFRSTIIPVSSEWGEDIVGVGWKVPLWNPSAYNAQPDVYPRPQSELEMAVDPASGSTSTRVGLAAPQELYFFTNTQPGFDDRTDLWPAVDGVDYVDLPAPLPPPLPPLVADAPDATLPDPAPVELGFAPVTFTLDPLVEREVNLVAERQAGKAVGAVLHSVTMMRAAPQRFSDAAAAVQREVTAILALRGQFEATLDLIRSRLAALGGGALNDELRAVLQREVAALAHHPELTTLTREIDRQLQDGVGVYRRFFFDSTIAVDPCLAAKEALSKTLSHAATRVHEELTERRKRLLRDVDTHTAATGTQLLATVEPWFVQARFLVRTAGTGLGILQGGLENVAGGIVAPVDAMIDTFVRQAGAESDRARDAFKTAVGRLGDEAAAAASTLLDEILTGVRQRLPQAGDKLAAAAQQAKEALRKQIAATVDALVAAADVKLGADLKTELEARAQQLKVKVAALLGPIDTMLRDLLDAIGPELAKLAAALTAIDDGIVARLATLRTTLNDGSLSFATYIEAIRTLTDEALQTAFMGVSNTLITAGDAAIDALCADVFGDTAVLQQVATRVRDLLGSGATGVIARLLATLNAPTLEELRQRVEDVLAEVGDRLEQYGDGVARGLKKTLGSSLAQAADDTLRLLRAFGNAPRVPGLDFNRQRIAFYFNEFEETIRTTPVAALVDRIGRDLKPFGIRLPMDQIGDRLLPIKLDDLRLSTLFPDFAGIKLDGLFPNLSAPGLANDKVKITHGIDKERRRAWLDAQIVDLPLGRRADLFALGPIAVRLDGGVFNAKAHIGAGADGQLERSATGQISGDWILAFGGQTLVTLQKTPLIFDGKGDLRFDLRPDRVALSGPLDFLSKLMATVGTAGEGSGLKVAMIKEGALPVGVECVLDLQLPPMTYGAFGVSGLRFMTGFQLRAYPEFSIAAAFALGSQRTPFTITVFILGGAGWIESRARYFPLSGVVETDLSLAIGASAVLAINLGVIEGMVQIFLGISCELHSRSGAPTHTTIRLLLQVVGHVRVLGIISATLEIALEVVIADGKVSGHGTARFTVRLGFIKKTVSAHVSYHFSQSSSRAAAPLAAAGSTSDGATRYLETLV